MSKRTDAWREMVESGNTDDLLDAAYEAIEAVEEFEDRQSIHTNDILNAYDAFEGDDVGTFTAAWDEYLAGTTTPCTEAADGLHYDPAGFGRGICALCGKVSA